jgi:hypothetical protein
VAVAPTLDAKSQLSPSNRLVSVFDVSVMGHSVCAYVRMCVCANVRVAVTATMRS